MIKKLQRTFSAILFSSSAFAAGTWEYRNKRWPAFIQRITDPNPSIYIPSESPTTFPLEINIKDTQDSFPTGCVIWNPADSCAGYLLCDGSAYSRTQYAELFSVIGTTYGAGDGSTTFNVPDIRDRYILGTTSDAQLGVIVNASNTNMATLEPANIPLHTHTYDGYTPYHGHNHGGVTQDYDPGYLSTSGSYSHLGGSNNNDSADGGTDLWIYYTSISPGAPNAHGQSHRGGNAGTHTHTATLSVGNAHHRGAAARTAYQNTPDAFDASFPFSYMNAHIRH